MSMPIDSAISDANEIVSESAERHPKTERAEPCVIDARFFDQHAHLCKRYAMTLVRRWADAEEVTQEAFCRLLEKGTITKAETESAAKAILFTTVRNVSLDRLRKQTKRKFEPLADRHVATLPESTTESGLQQLEAAVSAAMLELPDEWAEALQLKVNGRLSYAEIAEVLSVTQNQIRNWIFRARKQLQSELKKSGLF